MNKPLAVSKKNEAEVKPDKFVSQDNIIPIRAKHAPVNNVVLPLKAATGILGSFKNTFDGRDIKAPDYLLIALLALVVHGLVIENLKHMSLDKEVLPEPIKTESKVQITLVQPKVTPPPKPIIQPPPKPKVVPLKKPPKAKVKPKPAPQIVTPDPAPVTHTEAPNVAPVNTAPPPPPKVVEKITQPSAGAGYLNNPPPAFPEEAMERGWEGKVLLKVHVLASGKPDSVNLAKSSGHSVLDQEAIRTVKRWSFVPGKRGTTPIDGWVTVPIKFNLQN